MSEDARTEARRRLVTALHAAHCGCPDYPFVADPDGGDPLFGQLADAVLELFPDVWWQEFADANPAWGERLSRRPILAGPWEPVTKEFPDA